MKKILLTCAGFAFALSFLWAGAAMAANVRSGESPRIMSGEVINGTLYAAGSDVKMQGTVQGDLYCVGQNIEITGTVEGDVLCAGQNVTVSGTVLGDVRVAGQVVNIKGKVEGSASLIGQNVAIDSLASIGRDVTILGQQTSLAGTIGRDVESLGDSFTAAANIGRDLDVTATQVSLSSSAKVAGMFMYVSQADASVDSGAVVTGKTEHKQPPKDQGDTVVTPQAYISSLVFSFSSFMVIGLVLLFAAPRLVRATTASIVRAPFTALGAGFVGLVVPPVLALVLFITAIGMPLGVLLLLGWIASLLVGLVFTAYVVGQKIVTKLKWHDAWQHVMAFITGLFALFLVGLIPFVGGLVMFLAVVWGVGGLWYTLITRRGSSLIAIRGGKK